MRVALIQMEVKEKNTKGNTQHGLELLEEATKNKDVDVAILPEIWTTGYSLGYIAVESETLEGAVVTKAREIAVRNHCNIVLGSMPMFLEGKIFNNSVVINKQGEIVANYSKFHLFSTFHEDLFFSPGEKTVQYELDGIPCSNATCYDLRFPEMFRYLVLQGAKVIFVPAEWPTSRGKNWSVLAQARAVENNIFIVGVNTVGSYKGEGFYGHSILVSPTGRIICEGGESEEILYGDIDLEEMKEMREKFNVLHDLRPEFFRPEFLANRKD